MGGRGRRNRKRRLKLFQVVGQSLLPITVELLRCQGENGQGVKLKKKQWSKTVPVCGREGTR